MEAEEQVPSSPVTVYKVEAVDVAVTLAPVVSFKPVEGDQV